MSVIAATAPCPHPRAYGYGVNHPEFPKVNCATCGEWFSDPSLVGRNALASEAAS